MSDVQWNEAAIAEFTHNCTQQAVQIVTGRVAEDGRLLMPIHDPFRSPEPGESESKPPGRMRASVSSEVADSIIDGKPQGTVSAIWVYIMSHKHRHAIRPALSEALELQRGRPVP